MIVQSAAVWLPSAVINSGSWEWRTSRSTRVFRSSSGPSEGSSSLRCLVETGSLSPPPRVSAGARKHARAWVCVSQELKTLISRLLRLNVSLEHKRSQTRYICSNSQQYNVWVKIINFYFMPKIIKILRSCSMKIFFTVNISKHNFLLLICIAKNLIWTTLKMIFSIFRFFCTLRFQIFKYCPNHTLMEILFIQLSDDAYISISLNWHLWLVSCSRVIHKERLFCRVFSLLFTLKLCLKFLIFNMFEVCDVRTVKRERRQTCSIMPQHRCLISQYCLIARHLL